MAIQRNAPTLRCKTKEKLFVVEKEILILFCQIHGNQRKAGKASGNPNQE